MKTRVLIKFARAAIAALPLVFVTAAQASLIAGGIFTPMITAGAPPDSPANHVDPNTAASPFSGVVSINIRYNDANGVQQSFICSGTLVSKRDVVTAGHCIDTDGKGTVIDLTKAGNDVRVVFNSSGTFNALITADKVSMNPNYQGFGNCPAGVNAFCVNDDVAVIHLGQDAPASAKIYRTYAGQVGSGQLITMVGYGTTGDGINGYLANSAGFFVKRSGQNVMDLFDGNDENGWAGPNEVWYADFDGGGQNTFCTYFGACTPTLANDKESGIGGGDSGGSTFMRIGGEDVLVGTNTFSQRFTIDGITQTAGTFGTAFGGILLSSYTDYLEFATNGAIEEFVPEPGSLALVGIALLGMLGAGRRRRATAR